jgi:hypothetical protein
VSTFDELMGEVMADAERFGHRERNPGLMDKRLLTRFYHPRTLASPTARASWVQPDLHPFPS